MSCRMTRLFGIKARRPLSALAWMLALCLMAGCGRETPQIADNTEKTTVLHVAIAQEAAAYAGAQYLLNQNTRARMEEELGVIIQTDILSDTAGVGDLAALSFPDVLLSDDPMWIVPLVERNQLAPLSGQTFLADDDIGECGRYNGQQYAYPLTRDWHRPSRTVLLVLPESLAAAGIREIPYTAEALWNALETLSTAFNMLPEDRPVQELIEVYTGLYRTPLIVYGLPTEGGCSVLLGLFGLAPSGGREFQLSGTQVVLDKTTDAGREYLEYAAALHREGLIPYDFLSLSAYNAIMQFGSGLSPMTMIDEEHLDAAMDYAEQNGLHAAVAELPLPKEALEEEIYHRLVGMVSAGSPNQALSEALLCGLYEKTGDSESEEEETASYDTYPLFADEEPRRPAVYDPVERCVFDARLHYSKCGEDEVIQRFYARIAVNNLSISAFDDMLMQWRIDTWDEDAVETIADRFTRKYALQFSHSGGEGASREDAP